MKATPILLIRLCLRTSMKCIGDLGRRLVWNMSIDFEIYIVKWLLDF